MVISSEKQMNYRSAHDYPLPLRPNEKYLPSEDCRELLEFLYASQIDATKTEGLVTIAFRCARYAGMRRLTSIPASKLADFFTQSFYTQPGFDYYLCKSLRKAPSNWGHEMTFGYTFVAIEIDGHAYQKNHTPEELRTAAAIITDHICGELADDEKLPFPNAVIFSGRGLHLIWAIKQVPAAYDKMLREISAVWAGAISEMLSTDERFQGFEVDQGYCSNVNGLMRMPGTINSKNGLRTMSYMFHQNLHDIDELRAIYCAPTLEQLPIEESAFEVDMLEVAPSLPEHDEVGLKQFEGSGRARVRALEKLLKLRGTIAHGQRDIFLLLYCCSCISAGFNDEAALKRTIGINKKFSEPMKENEVISLLSSARREKYFFKTETIIHWLSITEEERKTIQLKCYGTTSNEKNFARDQKRACAKKNMIRQIVKEYTIHKNIAEVARITGHARNTITKYVNLYYSEEKTVEEYQIIETNEYGEVIDRDYANRNDNVEKIMMVPSEKSRKSIAEILKNLSNQSVQKWKIYIRESNMSCLLQRIDNLDSSRKQEVYATLYVALEGG